MFKRAKTAAAFDTAEKLGIPKLLDAEDMLVGDTPEQFSVMTYLSQMYRSFEVPLLCLHFISDTLTSL